MKRLVTLFISLVFLSGCASLDLRNLGKTSLSTGITYILAGPIPAIANAATSMAYDEIIPDEPSIDQIETEEQAVAFVAESLFMNLLYGFVAWLVITLIAVPYIRRGGYNKAKAKYKEVVFKSDMKL